MVLNSQITLIKVFIFNNLKRKYGGAVRQIRTSLSLDSDAALYSAQRPRHSARAAARFSLKSNLE